MTAPLLDVHDLSVRITRDEGVVRPLNGVSFRINTGQAVGIVGESGCGKTMTSNALLQILPPAAEITSGHIRYRRKLDEREIDLAALDAHSDEIAPDPGRRHLHDLPRANDRVLAGAYHWQPNRRDDPTPRLAILRSNSAAGRRAVALSWHPRSTGTAPTITPSSFRAACASGR